MGRLQQVENIPYWQIFSSGFLYTLAFETSKLKAGAKTFVLQEHCTWMSRWKLGSMVSKWGIIPIYPIYK